MTTYTEAKRTKKILEEITNKAGKALKIFLKGNMGITPDSIKSTNEFRLARKSYDDAFRNLREFNSFFTKKFKKEYAEDRKYNTY